MINIAEIQIDSNDQLREYQRENKLKIYELWKTHQSVMLQMPTGTGKTRLFASIVKDLHNTGVKNKTAYKVLILAHRQELIEQISENIGVRYSIAHGVIKSGLLPDTKKPTQIASVQTLQRRLANWEHKKFDVIIIDEAHHALAETYQKICNTFQDAKILGVTATPYRMSGKSFMPLFEKLIISQPVSDFIKQSYLSDYEYFSIPPVSNIQRLVDGITEFDFDGDYAEKALSRTFDNHKIRANLLETYKTYANNKKGIIYTINRAHNEHVCKMFCDAGIKAKAIDSKTKAEDRKQVVNEFKNGSIQILCNVNIFSEGFDCPDVEFIQLARPTKSLSMYLQQVGRGFRIHEGKDKVIFLDNVGLYNRFGLPSARRKWQKHFDGNPDAEIVNSDEKETKKVREIELDINIEEGNEKVGLIFDSSILPGVPEDIHSFDEVLDFPIFIIQNNHRYLNLQIENNLPLFILEYEEFLSIIKSHGKSALKKISFINLLPLGGPFTIGSSYKEFSNLKKIKKNGKWGIWNNVSKKIIITLANDEIQPADTLGRSIFRQDGKFGVVNCLSGEIILPPNYNKIIKVRSNPSLFIAQKSLKYGVVSYKNIIKCPFRFSEISEHGADFFLLEGKELFNIE